MPWRKVTSFQLVCNVTKFFGYVTITLQKRLSKTLEKKSYNFILLCHSRVNSFSVQTIMSKLNVNVLTTHI